MLSRANFKCVLQVPTGLVQLEIDLFPALPAGLSYTAATDSAAVDAKDKSAGNSSDAKRPERMAKARPMVDVPVLSNTKPTGMLYCAKLPFSRLRLRLDIGSTTNFPTGVNCEREGSV